MLRPLRRLARRVMERTGLIGPYYRWLERRQARSLGDEAVDDGWPMPPAELVAPGTYAAEATAHAWLAELARVLRPGGVALLTFHDQAYAQAAAPGGIARRLAGGEGYIVWNDAL